MKENFLLDPDIVFLNHGSFGATPRPVFEVYQQWQRELERQPVEFLGRRARFLLEEARSALADYVHCRPDEIVYTTNPTAAINLIVRSLDLQPGDEILSTDHEYGALERTWHFICRKTGAVFRQQPIPLPVTSQDDFVETFWAGVTPKTRIIFISQITSPTALIFPVAQICHKARQAGIMIIVDGAHAPGQVPLDLEALGADFYTGACHKWLMAPKGSAFLYARAEHHGWLEPLIVSWGYESEPDFSTGNRFLDYYQWLGTRDLAPFLAVPAAIEFQRRQKWDAVRARCHHLARDTRRRINALTGLPPICPETSQWFSQMCAARLPEVDLANLKTRLYDEFRIEIPVMHWNGIPLVRVSIQGYNDQSDADALIEALAALLPLDK